MTKPNLTGEEQPEHQSDPEQEQDRETVAHALPPNSTVAFVKEVIQAQATARAQPGENQKQNEMLLMQLDNVGTAVVNKIESYYSREQRHRADKKTEDEADAAAEGEGAVPEE